MARRALNDKTSNVNQSYLKRGYEERVNNVVLSLHALRRDGEQVEKILGEQSRDKKLRRVISGISAACDLLGVAVSRQPPGPRPQEDESNG